MSERYSGLEERFAHLSQLQCVYLDTVEDTCTSSHICSCAEIRRVCSLRVMYRTAPQNMSESIEKIVNMAETRTFLSGEKKGAFRHAWGKFWPCGAFCTTITSTMCVPGHFKVHTCTTTNRILYTPIQDQCTTIWAGVVYACQIPTWWKTLPKSDENDRKTSEIGG